jgi:hypothetical protein
VVQLRNDLLLPLLLLLDHEIQGELDPHPVKAFELPVDVRMLPLLLLRFN